MRSKKQSLISEINQVTAKTANKTWFAKVAAIFVHKNRHLIHIKQLCFL